MVRDLGNPYIAVILFQDGYRFIYRLHNIILHAVKMATVTTWREHYIDEVTMHIVACNL